MHNVVWGCAEILPKLVVNGKPLGHPDGKQGNTLQPVPQGAFSILNIHKLVIETLKTS